MAALLTPEWLDLVVAAAADLPERAGVSGHVRYVIGDGKRDEQSYDIVFTDGRVVAATLDADGEPDVVLNATRPVLASVVSGGLDSQAALMQGKVKSSATGPILRLLPLLQSDEWREVERTVAASTDA
jgi:putative sterol carrier protein